MNRYAHAATDFAYYVIPLKDGTWRVVRMSSLRYAYWRLAYEQWWRSTGRALKHQLEVVLA